MGRGFTIGHLNYHPDGGQLFFPLDPGAFVFTLVPRQRFLDRQGRVHARVSVEFADEFGCRLLIPGSI
jgi:ureidoglycolate hydrolase